MKLLERPFYSITQILPSPVCLRLISTLMHNQQPWGVPWPELCPIVHRLSHQCPWHCSTGHTDLPSVLGTHRVIGLSALSMKKAPSRVWIAGSTLMPGLKSLFPWPSCQEGTHPSLGHITMCNVNTRAQLLPRLVVCLVVVCIFH